MRTSLFSVLIVLLVIYVIVAVIFGVVGMYHYHRDLDAVIDRAQVAANAEKMLEYMQKLKGNMENLDAISGHTALVFKTDINDLAQHYEAVENIIERLEGVKGLPRSETAYQVALDDLRGTIRELPNPAQGLFWVRYLWWMILILVVWLGVIYVVDKAVG